MNLKWKRIFPITLSIWPYLLYFVAMLLSYCHLSEYPFEGGMTFSFVVFVSNIIYVCLCRDEEAYYHLAFWNMLIKLIHIAIFFQAVTTIGILFFLFSLIFSSPLTMVFLFFAAAILALLMITSSVYGISALIRAGRKQIVSKKYVIINIILQFIFFADVISAIILYVKVRKARQL